MTPDTIPQTVLCPDLFAKPLVATFDREQAVQDGGTVLLKAAERVYGLVTAFARCLADRHTAKIGKATGVPMGTSETALVGLSLLVVRHVIIFR